MPTHRELTQPVASAYLAMQAIVRRLWGLIPPLLLIGHWCVEVERHFNGLIPTYRKPTLSD